MLLGHTNSYLELLAVAKNTFEEVHATCYMFALVPATQLGYFDHSIWLFLGWIQIQHLTGWVVMSIVRLIDCVAK